MNKAAVAVLLGVAVAACASRADVETMGDALRAEIDSLAEGQRQMFARMGEGLDSLETSSLRRETTGQGDLERRTMRLEDLLEQLLESSAQNNQLLADIYENQRRTGPPAMGGPTTMGGPVPADAGRATSPGTDTGSQFYAMALEQFNRGNLETARDAFGNFLAVYGSHELAPDAQYWLARTYEEAGDPGNALDQYRRVAELYPDSNRAPAALYQRAMIEADRGNTALARRLLTQIENGYPNSPEAPEARRELARLGG
ncbi:tol-pal system protein YbgF [Candidatus Palauibacter sp.]|uniref:tol-pal system protein YbgF n=1 Tax=Candidatus Palauibacter sp. TaxID=3101350 RepID=UPI003B5A040E